LDTQRVIFFLESLLMIAISVFIKKHSSSSSNTVTSSSSSNTVT